MLHPCCDAGWTSVISNSAIYSVAVVCILLPTHESRDEGVESIFCTHGHHHCNWKMASGCACEDHSPDLRSALIVCFRLLAF